MNKYKLLKDLPGIPAGTESISVRDSEYEDAIEARGFDLDDYCFENLNNGWWSAFKKDELKQMPEWFAPVVDYREKLEEMGCRGFLTSTTFEDQETCYSTKKDDVHLSGKSYEAIYNLLTGKEQAKETKAIPFARADDPVTLDEICAYLKKKGDLFIKLSYEGYGSIINMENIERRNFRNLEQLKTILRS